jgi:hypothetical protein
MLKITCFIIGIAFQPSFTQTTLAIPNVYLFIEYFTVFYFPYSVLIIFDIFRICFEWNGN